MTIVDKIFYQQTFPTESFANIKLGVEMSLVPGVDDVQEAFAEARKIVHDAFHSMNPSSPESPPVLQVGHIQVDKGYGVDEMIAEINKCTEIPKPNGLESYRVGAYGSKNQLVIDAFENRFSELKNK